MNLSALVITPAAAAVVYLLLIVVIRRRAPTAGGVRQFEFMLAVLAMSGAVSVSWHLTNNNPQASDLLLRLITWSDLTVSPALLAFLAARHTGRWSLPARRTAFIVGGAIILVALSGSMNRAILEPVPEPSLIDQVIGYGAVLGTLATYLTALGYLVYSYRTERDPFERNRLKYLGIATVLIISGQLTNLAPALQQFPVDRTLALTAALLICYSLLRYRLFDIDLAFKRAVLTGTSLAIVAPAYLLVLFTVGGFRDSLLTPLMFLVGLGLIFPAAMAAHIVRSQLRGIADRLLLGNEIDRDTAAASFVIEAQRSRSTAELANLAAAVCQQQLAARYTAVLLRDPTTDRLETVSARGPLATARPRATIDANSALLAQIAAAHDPVTPVRLQEAIDAASKADAREFEPLGDCVLEAIVAHGEVIGLLALGEQVYDGAYSLNDLRLLTSIAAQAAIAIEGARLFEQVQTHADTDYLTGLPNHRRLKDLLLQTVTEAEQRHSVFSVAMVDVDNFKLLNDTHGHVAGDDALKKVGTFLRNEIRPDDIVGRYGGDEFMLIFPGAVTEEAVRRLTRIARDARRVSLTTTDSEWSAAERIPMRLSWGTASYPEGGLNSRTLVASADSDLLKRRYMRRRSGSVHTDRPSLRELSETNPQGVRIASGLLEILDAKDNYTTEHSQQVASLSLLLAEQLRLSDTDRETLWLGGLLHDIGKLNVPDEVLRKPGSLSPDEWTLIHEHPVHGERLALGLFGPGELTQIIGCHHERFDGRGYPSGLAGEEIPRLARAVSVCDAFSAMVHDRPYRKGLTTEEAVEELRAGAGTQWDPVMVEAFARAVGQEDAAPALEPRQASASPVA